MNIFTFSCLQGNAGPAGSKGALGAKGAKVTLTLFLLFLQRYIFSPLHLVQPLSFFFFALTQGEIGDTGSDGSDGKAGENVS